MNLRYEIEHSEKGPVEQDFEFFILCLGWMWSYKYIGTDKTRIPKSQANSTEWSLDKALWRSR